ncbi:MAG: hypothetical protein ABR921_04540 [Candidatus Sulfotelmatobacter sp.]|jgi:hypothetical protein
MDPRLLLLLPGLATCSTSPVRPTVHSLTPLAAPVYEWPEPRDHPEKTEPPHGDGSGESPLYSGLAVYGAATSNVSNLTTRVTVDSGASGAQPYISVAWLPNSFPLVVSTRDFDVELFLPPTSPITIQVGPDTTRNRMNPSAVQTRRSFTRRRG